MGQMGWGPGPAKVIKISKTCPHCNITSRKRQTENEKRFFSMSTRRLAESVEGLNYCLGLAAGDLWPKKSRSIAAIKRLMLQES